MKPPFPSALSLHTCSDQILMGQARSGPNPMTARSDESPGIE